MRLHAGLDSTWTSDASGSRDSGVALHSPKGDAEEMAHMFFMNRPVPDVMGSSQLQDAPIHTTQPSHEPAPEQTLPQDRRTIRAPDPFSHGSRHTHAAVRAARRSKRRR